jgi:hypothetical protein
MSTMRGGSAVFTPEAVAAINRAYLEACDAIAVESPNEQLRMKLAEHMMYLARNGESDPERLCSLSVMAVLGRKPRDHARRGDLTQRYRREASGR